MLAILVCASNVKGNATFFAELTGIRGDLEAPSVDFMFACVVLDHVLALATGNEVQNVVVRFKHMLHGLGVACWRTFVVMIHNG